MASRTAVTIARRAVALTAFAHQRDFYRSQGLEIAYYGHPLVSLVAPREPRPIAAADGGTIALLPGSRRGEIERHMPALLAAARVIRERRPNARFVVSAADGEADARVRRALGVAPLGGVEIVRGARPALDAADVDNEVTIYKGAKHGYTMPDLPVYDREAAERHWSEMLKLFGSTTTTIGAGLLFVTATLQSALPRYSTITGCTVCARRGMLVIPIPIPIPKKSNKLSRLAIASTSLDKLLCCQR